MHPLLLVDDTAPEGDRVTTMITTAHAAPDGVTVRLHGVLDRAAAVVLCELLLAHDAAGPGRRLRVEVGRVTAAEPHALGLLATTAARLSGRLVLDAFAPAVAASLAAADRAAAGTGGWTVRVRG